MAKKHSTKEELIKEFNCCPKCGINKDVLLIIQAYKEMSEYIKEFEEKLKRFRKTEEELKERGIL